MQAQRIKFLESEIKNHPNEPFNYYGLALEYIKTNAETADRLFKKLISEFPEYLPSYYTAADFFYNTNQIKLAHETYEMGIKLAKNKNEKAWKELNSAFQLFKDEAYD